MTSAGVGIGRDQILFASLLLGSLVLWIGEIVPILRHPLSFWLACPCLKLRRSKSFSPALQQQFLYDRLVCDRWADQVVGSCFPLCLMILEKAPPKQNWVAGIMFLMGFVLNPILLRHHRGATFWLRF